MRETIVKYLEGRYYLRDSSGSYEQRLARIDKEAKRRIPETLARLKILNAEYADLSSDKRTDPEYLRRLAIEVQNLDTQIVLARRGVAAVMTSVVYNYYHNGWSSSDVANELGIKPPMVREWLYRLNHSVGRVFNLGRKPIVWKPEMRRALFAMRATGKSLVACATAFNVSVYTLKRAWVKAFGKTKRFDSRRHNCVVTMTTTDDGKKRIAYRRTDSKPVGKGVSKLIRWTPELLRKLKVMHKTKSMTECAEELGTTKASVNYALTRACKAVGI